MIPSNSRGRIIPFRLCSAFAVTSLAITISFSSVAQVQSKRGGLKHLGGEVATCVIKVTNAEKGAKAKILDENLAVKPNQMGLFKRVANIKPMAKVPIEIAYPEGVIGEKVLLSVLDGGKLGNGRAVQVIELDSQKKVPFSFQVARDPGIYRVLVVKGDDAKVVQLYVGEEPKPVFQIKHEFSNNLN